MAFVVARNLAKSMFQVGSSSDPKIKYQTPVVCAVISNVLAVLVGAEQTPRSQVDHVITRRCSLSASERVKEETKLLTARPDPLHGHTGELLNELDIGLRLLRQVTLY